MHERDETLSHLVMNIMKGSSTWLYRGCTWSGLSIWVMESCILHQGLIRVMEDYVSRWNSWHE